MRDVDRLGWIEAVFFASGFAALTYQICWQRLLFASFGIDIVSVTIIVSTFMLGLGVGAIAGGWIADRFPNRLLALFAACEAIIGAFGLGSAVLIRDVGDRFVGYSLPVVAVVNFLLLLIPTALMGATLPMLVAHRVARKGGVGVSVGGLYFANTLGAAIGCLVIGFAWFATFELPTGLRFAAAINLAAAAIVGAAAWRQR